MLYSIGLGLGLASDRAFGREGGGGAGGWKMVLWVMKGVVW